LVPAGYKINTRIFFFNNPDPEKIRNIVKLRANEFINVQGKKLQFSLGVRLYALPHSVSSVRLVIVQTDTDDSIKKKDEPNAKD